MASEGITCDSQLQQGTLTKRSCEYDTALLMPIAACYNAIFLSG